MKYDAILFDFDGVLIESEYEGNKHLADFLTSVGHPISLEESMARFMGLAGDEFLHAIEFYIGAPMPDSWDRVREIENARALREGVPAVADAVAFVKTLPADLPIAITSSSYTDWLTAHLDHIGLRERFGDHIYSGREHVKRGKPAPDIYLYGAAELGVPIERCVILEDSPVGVTGALASGGSVIGFCGGRHCGPGHADRLRAKGVTQIAATFDEVSGFLA